MNESRTFRAPGRVNLIGEHTDYNLGFVLPIALDLATYVQTEPSADGLLRVRSEHHGEEVSWPANRVPDVRPRRHWSDYVAGVAVELARAGVPIPPLTLNIRSDVPEGSGLSSSAALEVSTALALLQGRSFDRLEIAKLCQRAESEFVGMPCGIMDQFVAIFGHRGSAIRIDCRSLEYVAVQLPPDVHIVAVNSMVKHELGTSAYRTRVEECAIAVDCLARLFPEVHSLRDATPAQLERTEMPAVAARRARHIVSENARVEHFVSAAERGDLARMGELFFESHRSMKHDYEITCAEVDFLIDVAAGIAGCYGARMTGGGFGGCTVNLVAPAALDDFREEIRKRYQDRFNLDPSVILCVPSDGAGETASEDFRRQWRTNSGESFPAARH